MNLFAKQDLQLADVLLYRCPGLVPRLTRELDGGGFSHVAIVTATSSVFDGTTVVEATRKGIEERDLSTSLQFANYVDVYRFRGRDGAHLCDDPTDAEAVAAAFRRLAAAGDRFVSDPNLLLAVVATRRAVQGGAFGPMVGQILEASCDSLARILGTGRAPLLAPELLYRGFVAAGRRFELRLLASRRRIIETVIEKFGGAGRELNAPDEQGFSAYEHFVARFAEAGSSRETTAREGGTIAENQGSAESGELLPELVKFVSPRDLETSPSLWFAGRLHVPD